MSSVSLDVLNRKKIEVCEDENRRVQSLVQFREWLAKHPFIKTTKIDDDHIVAFLRARKYQMNSVFQSFENFFLFSKKRPDWFDYRRDKFKIIMNLYDDGYIKVLKERDSEGRRIVLFNCSALDIEKYTADDTFRLFMLILFLLSIEEETQFCGVIFVYDMIRSMNMKFLSMFSISSFYDFGSEALKMSPLRVKNISLVGLPTIAIQFLNAMKLGLSAKMKNRISIIKGRNELWERYDKNIFTQDVDGNADEKEIIEDFRKIIEEKIEFVRSIFDSYEIDEQKAMAVKKIPENIGSFRKLEID